MTKNIAQIAYDKLEIQDLITRYAFTFDGGDLEAWADLFTEDMVWELRIPIRDEPVMTLTGKKTFVDYMTKTNAENRALYSELEGLGAFHLMAGTTFDELTDTTARTRTMAAPLMQSFNDDGKELDLKNWHSVLQAQVLFGGIYHGWYRKVDGEWKIAKKIFYASPNALKIDS